MLGEVAGRYKTISATMFSVKVPYGCYHSTPTQTANSNSYDEKPHVAEEHAGPRLGQWAREGSSIDTTPTKRGNIKYGNVPAGVLFG